jgi:predicted MFS family arabinose efflux permease
MPSTTATVHPVQPASNARSGFQIFIMAVAAFVIVTTEYGILGLLPTLARDLQISVAMAGQLVTLFAFTVMLAGPFLTAKLSHLDRKKLFTFILLVFAGSNVLAALAPNVWVLGLARFIPALLLPVFWGTASETAGQLAGPGKSGKAVSQVYMGISAALVFGVPLGTLAADAMGWRSTFWMLAVLSLVLAGLIYAFMPTLPAPARTEGGKQTVILKDRNFLAHVALSTLAFTAMFTAYTYLADMLEKIAQIPANQVGWWLMGFGAVGMVGNYVGGRMVDRSPLGATVFCLLLLGVGMLAAVPLAAQHAWLVLALIAWALAYTALFPICQVRVMQAGKKAQALAGTMNVSAANAGTGLGAVFGGFGIQHAGLESLGLISTVIAAIAVAFALVMMRRKQASQAS